MALSLTAAVAQAAPTGGQVVSGTGDITQSGVTTTIQQSSQNLSLSWLGFNTTHDETVNFLQPNAAAIAVNRIFDTNGTQFLGHLNANGQVYLINPNGILFGQGAQVNVGGLVASTLDFNDSDLEGNTRKFSGDGTGSVINQGTITAANGGYVALLGNHVGNQGVIVAQLGTVALGAGSAATLTFSGNSLVHLQVDESVLNSLAENGGLIRADGGMVVMTAGAKDALLASVVNNTGVIEARTVDNQNGTITLLGGMQAGTVNVDGTLDASAPDGGNGGFIETSAAHVKVADTAQVTTAAANGNTGTWLIDPVDFTIGAGNGAQTDSGIGADTLSGLLGSNNINIATSPLTAGNGDIFVNSAVSWSANRLRLSAHRNIDINANLNASGTASLALEYGLGAVAAGNVGTYNLNNGARVNLPAGQNFSTRLGSDGVAVNYTVITSLGAQGSTTATDLQGMNGDRAGHYVLGADIDATTTNTWNAAAGFEQIGVYLEAYRFTGSFDGLGHTISNLYIMRPSTDLVGLFGFISAGASVRNVGLLNARVWGHDNVGALAGYSGGSIVNSYVDSNLDVVGTGFSNYGGLVGQNAGTISNSYANIDVTAANMNDSANVGGLVGNNTGTITQSHATGDVSGNSYTGGLAGLNTGTISYSYADTGSVTGGSHGTFTGTTLGADIGGLVGHNEGAISYSHASGNVSGNSSTGGLVGANNSTISNSYATGTVTGIDFGVADGWAGDGTGGLVGYNSGAISNSYATGNVASTSDSVHCFNVGGLVGSNFTLGSTITNSYATGNVTGSVHTTGNLSYHVGGLAGENNGTITNSYATGNVSGNDRVGGLVGRNVGTTGTSYATGLVNGITNVGALVGYNNWGTISGSYWNSTVNNTLIGVGNGPAGETTGLTTVEMLQQSNFASLDFNNVWIGYDGHSNPLLRSFMTALTVTANNATKTYDGQAYTGNNGASYSVTPNGNLLGSITYGGTSQGAVNANTYTITASGLYSNQQGYIISYADGSLTVDRRALSIAGSSAASKTYDGNTTASVTAGTLSGLVSGEALGVSASGTFNSQNVTEANTVAASYALANGAGGLASNYSLAGENLAANITARALTASVTAPDKVYDGNTTAAPTLNITGGLVGSETVIATGTATFNSRNVLDANLVTVNSTVLGDGTGGGLASNYSLAAGETVIAHITPRALTGHATIAAVNTTYGTAAATGAVSFDNIVSGDIVSSTAAINNQALSGSGNLNAGNYTQTASTLAGADAGNYSFAGVTSSANYHVAQRALAGAAIAAVNTTYGTPTATGAVSFSNIVSGDTVSSTAGINNQALSGSGNLNAGNYTQTASTLAGADAANYSFAGVTSSANYHVGQRALTGAAIAAVNTTYGTAAAAGALSFGNIVFGDSVTTSTATLNGTSTSSSGNLNAGNYTQTVSGTLGGADAGNYSFAGVTSSANYHVGQRALTGAAIAAVNTTYGTAAAAGAVSFGNIVSGDSVSSTAGINSTLSNQSSSGNLNAGNYTQTASTLAGADAANYSFAGVTSNANYDVARLAITVSGITVDTKVYDDTNSATLNVSNATYGGSITNDVLDIAADGVTGTFVDQNAGTNKAVNLSGVTLSGADAANYTADAAGGVSGDITARAVTLTAQSVSKTYDGGLTYTATAGDLAALSSALVGDDTVTAATIAYTDRNAGTNKQVNFNGATVNDGNGGNNYIVTLAGNSTSTIDKAALAINAVTDSKTYDATTASAGTVSFSGLVGGDTVTGASQVFGSKNVMGANGSTLSVVDGYAVNDGNGGGNYTVTEHTATGTINQANLEVTGLTAGNKVYDGTNAATLGGTAAVTVLGSDSIALGGTASGTFSDQNAATGKTVTITGNTLSGTDAGNYHLVQQTGLTADITRAALTVTAGNDSKIFDGVAYSGGAGVSYDGFVHGETAGVLGGTLVYGGTSQGAINAGSFSIVASGLTSGNYTLSYVDGSLRIIPLVLSGGSLKFPSISNAPGSTQVTSVLPVSIQSMSQLGSESEKVASSNDTDGTVVMVLEGGVRLPADALQP